MPHFYHGASGSFESLLIDTVLLLAALTYLRGWSLLRPQSPIAAWRACSFLAGLFLIWVAAASPLSALDHASLTVHMVKHLLLMTVAPPLIWLGEPVHCVARVFRPATPALHYTERVFLRPDVCWLAAAAALIGWHIPAVFTLALHAPVWHFVEQLSFLVTGLLFWWPVIQPWPSAPASDLSMILYLFFATLPCDILSGFLVFCDRVVYPVYLSSPRLFSFTALEDQQCAAALMWTCVTLIYLLAGTILTMRLLSPEKRLKPESMLPALHAHSAPHKVHQSAEAF
jgi:putative membrane protein